MGTEYTHGRPEVPSRVWRIPFSGAGASLGELDGHGTLPDAWNLFGFFVRVMSAGAVVARRTEHALSNLIQNGRGAAMRSREHWDAVYEQKDPEEVSWYRPHLERSLRFIEAAGLAPDAAIIDVGGGASTLVDDLLARGYVNVTVLDISPTAIASAQARLGERASAVRWLTADITQAELPASSYDFWHDRAVFHFLRDQDDRRRYVAAAQRSVRSGGHVLVATFGPEGPARCSGLEVARYDPDGLYAQFGAAFQKIGSSTEVHTTPWGTHQQFVYCDCRVREPG